MASSEVTVRIAVDGMTCGNCERRIEKAVRALDGVRKVSASASLSEVRVSFDAGRIGFDAIRRAIGQAGYAVKDEQVPEAAPAGSKSAPALRFLGLLAVVAGVLLVIRFTVGFTFLPTVSQNMGYGLIFVVGLLTSLHCIAMCGGIALSQGLERGSGACAEPGELPRGGARRLAPTL
jgi:copper chaperone CopZ